MILNKVSTSNVLAITLGLLLCLMAVDSANVGKITRSKTPAAVTAADAIEAQSAMENSTINSKETEADSAEDTTIPETNRPTDEKQAVTSVATTDDAISSLSIWGIVRSVWNWIREDLSESLLGTDDDDDNASSPTAVGNGSAAHSGPVAAVEGRTFGKIRRLQMALIPIIFKFGVLSAMVAFLVMLGMKTLFLVKLLVLMNAAVILGKFLTLKTNLGGHIEHAPASVSWGYSNWNPHTSPSHGWSATAPSAPAAAHPAPSKEIHLHIHGAQAQPQVSAYSTYGVPAQAHTGGWERRNDPYSGYEPVSVSDVDFENELNNQGPIASLPTKYPANHRY